MASLKVYSVQQERCDLHDAGYQFVRNGLIAGAASAVVGTAAVGVFGRTQQPRKAALSGVAAVACLAASSMYALMGKGVMDAAARVTTTDGAVTEMGPVRVSISAPRIIGATSDFATVERIVDFKLSWTWLYSWSWPSQ